jgi:hypothetical protein
MQAKYELLMKNGPFFWLKFLKTVIKSTKAKGDTLQAAKVTGIIQKEATQKQSRRVNRSIRKVHGNLTIRVKVPTSNGGYTEYKTKGSLFKAVSPILVERFQSALVAPCHQGTFFKDVGNLVDGPVSQQILEGRYVYPQDLDPAMRLLFEEATHTYATLSPLEVFTYFTPEDFQHFWQTACKRTGSSYSRLHFGHYVAASFCPDLSLVHAAKLSICARKGMALACWGKGLTVLLDHGKCILLQALSNFPARGQF